MDVFWFELESSEYEGCFAIFIKYAELSWREAIFKSPAPARFLYYYSSL